MIKTIVAIVILVILQQWRVSENASTVKLSFTGKSLAQNQNAVIKRQGMFGCLWFIKSYHM